MKTLDCVIIEDNPIDRALLESYVSTYGFLRLVGSFSNPIECLGILKTARIDMLLSDIDMPGMNGIEFFKSLENPPLCIFITVHPEFALDAFDVQAIDYLLKPLKPERFRKALERAMELIDIKGKAVEYSLRFENNYLMVKEGTVSNRVQIADILYLEALTNYTKIITFQKKYITLNNLKNFLECLPEEDFVRIHRSYAVAVDKIRGIEANEILIGDQRLPLGKTYKPAVKKLKRSM